MNPLKQFENDQRLLNELKDLFEFVPPSRLRRSIEDIFFNLLASEEEAPVTKEIASHIYLVINFLNEVEDMRD